MTATVADNADASRYELTVDGAPAGFITYRMRPGVITLLHAEVDPDRERQGLGSKMVAETLDQIRSRGLAVRPVCPFVAAYIESHPTYADLVG